MNYTVLARKWRPQTFNQMVGQEHILRMLTNALDLDRLHHAYLFTGTRGVGKTSLARILAKCLNCETGPTSNPCGNCSICTAIDSGKFLDLLEIDAASRTKVEDTRELLDNVQYAPSQGRYKIYLIDEVHMLSSHSFNALLKTLEEPPAHVKFLLATTDPKKLPITILSRCLQFNLKRVPVELIAQQLAKICAAENTPFTMDALNELAQAADGSMRDALSLLDQAIAFTGNNISASEMQRMLGKTEQNHITELLETLVAQDGAALLACIQGLAEHAPDFQQLLENILSCLHQVALAQTLASDADPALVQLAKNLTPEEVQLFYQIALIGRRDLPLAATPQQGFEMVMLRMLAFKPTEMVIAPQSKKTIANNSVTPTPATPVEPKLSKSSPAQNAATIQGDPNDPDWHAILPQLKLSGMTQALAANCEFVQFADDCFQFHLAKNHEPMLNKNSQERLEEALSTLFNKKMVAQISLRTTTANTNAKQTEELKKSRHESAVSSIKQDDKVQKIIDVFDATLDINSIKAVDPA